MAKKTYAPTLIYWLHKICVYIARYRAALVAGLEEFGVTDADAKIDAVLLACEAIMSQYNRPANP